MTKLLSICYCNCAAIAPIFHTIPTKIQVFITPRDKLFYCLSVEFRALFYQPACQKRSHVAITSESVAAKTFLQRR